MSGPPDLAAVRWEDGAPVIVDQRRLPDAYAEWRLTSLADVEEAISTLAVRGAPAIGIAAGYGLAAAIATSASTLDGPAEASITAMADHLAAVRPTAVNLRWATLRVRDAALSAGAGSDAAAAAALAEARAIHDEDRVACAEIGRQGAAFLGDRRRIMTHCNTGRLATGGIGTALGIVYALAAQGASPMVMVCETRPLLQGARLTSYELDLAGIDVTLIPDTAAGEAMRKGLVEAVVVGCDRVAANGDTANKVGTYQLAVLAAAHDIPFLVAGPTTSFDAATPDGGSIPIEIRDGEEVRTLRGQSVAPKGVNAWNPAFDVTPARLIHAFVTEAGVLRPPFPSTIRGALETARARRGSAKVVAATQS